MASSQWDLMFWKRASDLIQQAERIQRSFFEIAVSTRYQPSRNSLKGWTPPINVIESERNIWVLCALPGVSMDNVEVLAEAGELIIRGRRPLPECCQQGELKIWEFPLGLFERRLQLPSEGELSVTERSIRDGLLIIELRRAS